MIVPGCGIVWLQSACFLLDPSVAIDVPAVPFVYVLQPLSFRVFLCLAVPRCQSSLSLIDLTASLPDRALTVSLAFDLVWTDIHKYVLAFSVQRSAFVFIPCTCPQSGGRWSQQPTP